LNAVRRQGYAADEREIEEDVECIAAPIRNHLGGVVASISVSGPLRKIRVRAEGRFVKEVKGAAARISARLGYIEKK
jgi:DNA-binding IclR family transcriptional regulator